MIAVAIEEEKEVKLYGLLVVLRSIQEVFEQAQEILELFLYLILNLKISLFHFCLSYLWRKTLCDLQQVGKNRKKVA